MQKYKKYLKIGVVALVLTSLLIVTLNIIDFTFGSISDFSNQHVKFIEYLRMNFSYTHDLFPQIAMNYGLGQNFVSLYYHGLYNPFIMITYLFPYLNIINTMQLISALVIFLTVMFMYKLLELNNIKENIKFFVSLMMGFSGVIIYHLSHQIMFIYYIPFFILSLIGLEYLAQKKHFWIYPISFALVFYTNFFFATITSIFQFLYYVSLLKEKEELKISNIILFFKYYIIGLLMGMLILLPQIVFVLSGGRTPHGLPKLTLINSFSKFVNDTNVSLYISGGIGVICGVAIIGSLFCLKDLRSKVLIILVIAVAAIPYFNYFLNVFQYVHYKMFIYCIPIIYFQFAKVIDKIENKKTLTLIYFLAFIILMDSVKLTDHIATFFYITSSLLIYFFTMNRNFKVRFVLTMLIIGLNVGYAGSYVSEKNYLKKYDINGSASQKTIKNIENTEKINNANAEVIPYRNLHKKYNELYNICDFSPTLYTSLENTEYVDFTKSYYEWSNTSFLRQNPTNFFDNMYARNFLGLVSTYPKTGLTYHADTNPIFFGIDNAQSYSNEELENLVPLERTASLNQGIFVEDENNKLQNNKYQNKFKLEKIYEDKNTFELSKIKSKTITIPEEYQKAGMLIVTVNSDIKDDDHRVEKLKLNGITNTIAYQDRYGKNENRLATFLIDTNKDLKSLKFSATQENKNLPPIKYSDLQVYYQTKADFETKKMQIYKPENFDVILNHQYNFEINQKADGYLASSIPYDNSFEIYVDGQRTPLVKIDNEFIGTKLTKGKHKIEVKYEIKGFKLGILLTILGVIFLIISNSLDNKKYKKVEIEN